MSPRVSLRPLGMLDLVPSVFLLFIHILQTDRPPCRERRERRGDNMMSLPVHPAYAYIIHTLHIFLILFIFVSTFYLSLSNHTLLLLLFITSLWFIILFR